MLELKDIVQKGDWKQEKHVPAIEVLKEKTEGIFNIKVTVGKDIEHPNTTEHHIAWIELYFLADGEKFVKDLGRQEFNAHGSSIQGPNTSGIVTDPSGIFRLRTMKNGELIASSFCNIHGLWQGSAELKI